MSTSAVSLSVSFSQRFDIGVRTVLSVTSANLNALDVTQATGGPRPGRLPADAHCRQLLASGGIQPGLPTWLLSVRNFLSNLRVIACVGSGTEPRGVATEAIAESRRPYHVLGSRRDAGGAKRLVVEEWDPRRDTTTTFDWFLSGVPVVWDDESGDQLLRRLVPEASDVSHVWRIPRGKHPEATPETQATWTELNGLFDRLLTATRDEAADQLIKAATDEKLAREDSYCHHLLGVDAQGRLCELIGTGTLEALGAELGARYGVSRAICVDNGGSIEVRHYPKGDAAESTQLAALPNHRPPGTAYLAVQARTNTFVLEPSLRPPGGPTGFVSLIDAVEA
jgi:hypothetical protein